MLSLASCNVCLLYVRCAELGSVQFLPTQQICGGAGIIILHIIQCATCN